MYKFHYEDRGFCRVYYRKQTELRTERYCIQDDGYGGVKDYKFYYCTPDGEPQDEVKFPPEASFDKLVYPS